MWIIVFVGLIATIIAQFIRFDTNFTTFLIVLPIMASASQLLYANISKLRYIWRKLLNLLNWSTFDMEFSVVFKFKNETNFNIDNDYLKIQDIIYNVLIKNGIQGRKNELVEVSLDRISGAKFYVYPYKMYITIGQTDNFGEEHLNLKAFASLKYKNGEKIIEDFNVQFYSFLVEQLKLIESKYIMKLKKNTRKENFMAKHFIKELNADQVKNFEISIDHPNVKMTANQKEIILVAKEKSYLINAIKDTVKFIT